MKKIIFTLTVISFFWSCLQPKKTKSVEPSTSKKIINSLLDDWHNDATKVNYQNYFSKMDSISVFIGTDASENWTKLQFENFSKPYFDAGKAWSFSPIKRNIYLNTSGNFAWFDELLKTQMGICRGSGVLEKINHNWKIKHYVLSITIPNDNVEKITKLNKEKDSVFLSTLKN